MSFPPKVLVGEIDIPLEGGRVTLHGDLQIPRAAIGLVLFVHGSGSSRHSTRNQRVAAALRGRRIGTLLFDLLTEDEALRDDMTAEYRFDVEWLAGRLRQVTAWAAEQRAAMDLPFGYFGASTGAAAALIAATQEDVRAVVSRGGRPDLALEALPLVRAATLLVVGGDDQEVIRMNWLAYERLIGVKRMEIVPDAGHLFEEPGKLNEVAQLAGEWFEEHLPGGEEAP